MRHRGRIDAARIVAVLGVALALLIHVPVTSAADELESAPAQPSKWEFDALLYAWVTGTYGTLNVKGNTVKIDTTPSDVIDLLLKGDALAGSGYFSVAYDDLSVFADAMGGYAEVKVDEQIPTQLCNCTLGLRAKDTMKFVIADFALGYRLGQWSLPGRRRPFTVGVYAGARYMYFSNELEASGGVVGAVQRNANVFDSIAWADPILGARFSLPLLDWASFDFRGDIGGFGASSDLVWGLVGTARIWLPWKLFSTDPYLAAGYRVAAFDRSNTDDSIDLQLRGPVLGAGFVF